LPRARSGVNFGSNCAFARGHWNGRYLVHSRGLQSRIADTVVRHGREGLWRPPVAAQRQNFAKAVNRREALSPVRLRGAGDCFKLTSEACNGLSLNEHGPRSGESGMRQLFQSPKLSIQIIVFIEAIWFPSEVISNTITASRDAKCLL
jgi:hypothetical protein